MRYEAQCVALPDCALALPHLSEVCLSVPLYSLCPGPALTRTPGI